MNSKQQIKEYLREHCQVELEDDDDIFELGLVTSLFAMQLLLFIEHRFGIQIDGKDMERDNFRSVNAITALVERHAG